MYGGFFIHAVDLDARNDLLPGDLGASEQPLNHRPYVLEPSIECALRDGNNRPNLSKAQALTSKGPCLVSFRDLDFHPPPTRPVGK